MKIILLRHGNPNFTASWLRTADDAKSALEAFASSHVTANASNELLDNISSVAVCISSKLARAIDSAALIGFEKSDAIDLFNESEIPCPNKLYLPLPWGLFVVIYRIAWFFGSNKNCPGKVLDLARASEASEYLAELASRNTSVLLVGHGFMNRLISTELKKSGWVVDSKSGSGYWSTISLSHLPQIQIRACR